MRVPGKPRPPGRRAAACLATAVALAAPAAGRALAGGGRATASGSRPAITRILIPLPDAGDVSYGVAQVTLGGRSVRPAPGSVFSQRVGGAAISATLAQWRSLRRTVHVYVVDSTVAGATRSTRDIAFFVVRARGRGPAAGRASVTFTISGARAQTGSFWVHHVSTSGVASVFTVRDLVRTAIRNWSRYLAALTLAHAIEAALRPILPHAHAQALAARASHRVGGRMWTGGERPDALTEQVFQLIFGTLQNASAFAAAKRSPLVPAFIERELRDPALAARWRAVVAQLPITIPDRFAAAAREEAAFTSVHSPLISSRRVVIADLRNSTTVGREQVPAPPPPPQTTARTQLVIVSEAGSGAGLVTDVPPDEVQAIAHGLAAPIHIDCGDGVGACSYAYPAGSEVALYAQPATGSAFPGWPACASPADGSELSSQAFAPPDEVYCTRPAGDCDADTNLIGGASVPPYGTYASCELTIPADPSGPRTVTVSFDRLGATPTEPLTVAVTGSGSVASSPAGIGCPGACAASFPQDEVVTLTATPAPGHALLGWTGCYAVSGSECTVAMQSAATVTAGFVATHALSVTESGTGGGSVVGDGISCPTTCTGVYDSGTQVTLSADSDASSTLAGWSGCDYSSVTAKACTVTLGSDRAVTATFTHNPRWMLDGAFGTGGTVLTPVDSATSFPSGAVAAMAVQSNGDIVAVGGGTVGSGTPATYVVRYTPAGSLDPSFGRGGVVTIAESGSASDPITAGKFLGDAVAVQPDGKIVVAGGLTPSGSLNTDFSMVRLTSGGALDTGFAASSGGVVDTPIASGTTGAVAVLIDPASGDIYLGGEAQSGTNDFALADYDPTGALMTSFGSGGTVLTPVGSGAAAMTSMIWDNGDIVAAGKAQNASSSPEGAVAVYLPNGSLDGSFNHGAPLLTPIGTSPPNAWATGAAVQNGNQIVLVAGNADYNGRDCIGLERLNTDGTLDTGFGASGYTDVCPTGSISTGTGVVVDQSGTIYVVGYLESSPSQPVLLHLSDAGQLDPSFGSGGAIVTSPNGAYPAQTGPIVLDGGEVVIGGSVDSTRSSEGVPGTPELMLQGFGYR